MRILMGVLFLVAGLQANAANQTNPSTTSNFQSGMAQLHQNLAGLSVYAQYGLADEFTSEGNRKDVGDFTSTTKSSAAAGFGAEYQFPGTDLGLGFNGGINYEMARTLNKTTYRLKNNQRAEADPETPKPEVSAWVPYANADFHLLPRLAVFGGGNYNFPNIKNFPAGSTVKGKIGYQVGASFLISPNLGIDGMYRVLNMSSTSDSETNDNIALSGFVGRVRFLF